MPDRVRHSRGRGAACTRLVLFLPADHAARLPCALVAVAATRNAGVPCSAASGVPAGHLCGYNHGVPATTAPQKQTERPYPGAAPHQLRFLPDMCRRTKAPSGCAGAAPEGGPPPAAALPAPAQPARPPGGRRGAAAAPTPARGTRRPRLAVVRLPAAWGWSRGSLGSRRCHSPAAWSACRQHVRWPSL